MDTTSSGLRYMIYNKTKGDKVKMGNEVSVNVKIERLDGTICYQTDTISGKESILIGKSDVESGIQEGIRLMRLGEKAKFILPSYLGHGLLGDRYTIPPQAILYVDVKLLEIK
jgi:FKBP-type peptidyl-prolyl cis-trans isomerase